MRFSWVLSWEYRFSKISAGYPKIPAINLAEKEKLIMCKMHRWDFIFSFGFISAIRLVA